jgi:hypothetical protein
MFVTNGLSGFEISLVRIPCKASQHSHDVCCCCQGLPDAGCALLSGQHAGHVHMTSVRCWIWHTTTPARPAFRRLSIFRYFPLSRRPTSWQENMRATLHIYGDVVGLRGSTLCLDSRIGPPGEGTEKKFNGACGRESSWCAEYVAFLLDCHELPVVP